jgi:NAD(P)H-hydrate epimerase
MNRDPIEAVLSCAQMGRCDAATIAAGTPGFTLMMRAGVGVACAIRRRYRPQPVLIACGPGNNGGDGFVIADDLRRHGWPVWVALLCEISALKGDAAEACALWSGPIEPLSPASLEGAALLVDAVFGAGLTRAPEGAAADLLFVAGERVEAGTLISVAVDVPSGLDGDTGRARGGVCPADMTVTFHLRKPAHLIQPGRALCGDVRVIDIGIIPDAMGDEAPVAQVPVAQVPVAQMVGPGFENGLGRGAGGGLFKAPGPADHKYTRGHVVIVAGEMTGAARLAALAARRAGAGLVTVLAPPGCEALIGADAPGLIVVARPQPSELAGFLDRRKAAAVVVGPGLGLGDEARALVEAVLASGVPVVLDADGLSVFAGDAAALSRAISGPVILTPHGGEFARLFPDIQVAALGKLEAARRAADAVGATLLLKGPDTVIASPSRVPLILDGAPSVLATGGTGDVLAGIAGCLLGQSSLGQAGGVGPDVVAMLAARLHAEAARRCSSEGTIPIEAEDVAHALPQLIGALWRTS